MGDLVHLSVEWHGPSRAVNSRAAVDPSPVAGAPTVTGQPETSSPPRASGATSTSGPPEASGPGLCGWASFVARPEASEASQAHLIGASLRWKRFRPWSVNWMSGRCSVCHVQFGEPDAVATLHSGYSVVGGGPAGQDDYYWVCLACVEKHAAVFGWSVLATGIRVP